MLQKLSPSIPWQEVVEVLNYAMGKAVEVNITTALVADLDCLESEGKSGLSLSTCINLLNNTVNNEIDLKLIDNPAYRELQRWHIEQVKQRQDSLVTNLASLAEMQHIVSGKSFIDD